MEEKTQLTPTDYLDRFFEELRREVRDNPKLASRLVEALGGEVVFDSADKAEIANPYALVATGSKAHFYAIYSSMKLADIKRVLRDHNLATSIDVQGKATAELVDMLYERATAKVAERTSATAKIEDAVHAA